MFSPVAVDGRQAPPPATLDAGLLTARGLGTSPAAGEDQLTAGAASTEVCGPETAGEPLATSRLSLVLSAAQVECPAAPNTLRSLQCHSVTVSQCCNVTLSQCFGVTALQCHSHSH